MDRHRDRSVMDRGRELRARATSIPGIGTRAATGGEGFDREGYGYRRAARRRLGPRPLRPGGGYGQGSAGGFNEQHTSDYRSDYTGEDRWRSGRQFDDCRSRARGSGYQLGAVASTTAAAGEAETPSRSTAAAPAAAGQATTTPTTADRDASAAASSSLTQGRRTRELRIRGDARVEP